MHAEIAPQEGIETAPRNATPPRVGEAAIHFAGVEKRFGDKAVLSGIDLAIPRGSLFGLLGPNGAGKTTLLSILFGLMAPTRGRVLLDGIDVAREGVKARRRMSLVPQRLAFYPMLTGRENLDVFARAAGLDSQQRKARTDWCIEVAGLSRHLNGRAEHYSGGLKRRLNLAIGLLTRPELLCLDEPTVGIDPQSRRHILDALLELVRDGMTVLYTSHYMEEVEAICTDIAIIDHGRILKAGTKQALLALGSRQLDVQVRGDMPDACSAIAAELKLFYRDGRFVGDVDDVASVLQRLLGRLAEVGIEPLQIRFGDQGLESLFLDLTSRQLRD